MICKRSRTTTLNSGKRKSPDASKSSKKRPWLWPMVPPEESEVSKNVLRSAYGLLRKKAHRGCERSNNHHRHSRQCSCACAGKHGGGAMPCRISKASIRTEDHQDNGRQAS